MCVYIDVAENTKMFWKLKLKENCLLDPLYIYLSSASKWVNVNPVNPLVLFTIRAISRARAPVGWPFAIASPESGKKKMEKY